MLFMLLPINQKTLTSNGRAKKKIPVTGDARAESRLVVFQPVLNLIVRNNFLTEGVGASFWRLYCLNYLGECFSLTGFEGRYYFLCHNYLISL